MPSSHKRKAKAKAKAKAALTLGPFIKDVRVRTQGGGRAGPEAVLSSTRPPCAGTLSAAGLYDNNKDQFDFGSKMQK